MKMRKYELYICLLYFVSFAACELAELSKLGDNFYYFNQHLLEWENAQLTCRGLGLELATIESRQEQSLITEYLIKISEGQDGLHWLGGSEIKNARKWIWMNSGSRLKFQAWGSSESNSNKNEKCLAMSARRGDNWSAVPCQDTASSICELENPENRRQKVELAAYKNNFYYFHKGQPLLSWSKSKEFCQSIGMELIKVQSYEVNLFLDSYIRKLPVLTGQKDFWLGGQESPDKLTWQWLDDTTLSYQAWYETPNSSHPEPRCLEVRQKKLDVTDVTPTNNWFDGPCSYQQRFICDHPIEPLEYYMPELLQLDHLTDRYYYFSKEQLSWTEAEEFCHNNGLELATIETDQEQATVTQHLRLTEKYSKLNWLGGINSEDGWQWSSTDDNLTFTAWDEVNELSNDTQQCLVIAAHEGNNWRSLPCTMNLTFICEMNDTINRFSTVEHHEFFPNILQEYEGNFYYFSDNASFFTWPKAKQFCNSYGMTLAMIETEEENNFIHDVIEQLKVLPNGRDFWLGGSDNGQPDSWFWPENARSQVNFTAWSPDLTDVGGVNCLEMKQSQSSNESWFHQLCTYQQRLICEFDQMRLEDPVTMETSSIKIIVNQTQDFQFTCDVKRPILSCSVITPCQRTLSLSPWTDVLDSRYKYVGLGLDTGQCGLQVVDSNIDDSGSYTCLIVLDPSRSSIVGNVEVKVQEIKENKIYWKLIFLIFFASVTVNVTLILVITFMCNRRNYTNSTIRRYTYRLKPELHNNGKPEESSQPLQLN